MIKLVAIDLDGTLLNTHKELSEENKQAIQEVKAEGVKVVLCTGRPLKAIAHLLDDLQLRNEGDYAVTYNGGLIQKTDTEEIVSQVTLTKEDAAEIYEMTQSLRLPVNFLDLKHIYEPPYPEGRPSLYPQHMVYLDPKKVEMNELPEELAINKIVIHTKTEYLEEAIPEIPVSYYDQFSVMKSHPYMLEFMHKEADKGKGLKQLAAFLDIRPEEVMAIGDQENDLEMIQFAGTAVAMGNAVDTIKDQADYVTRTENEHGVAYALDKLVLEKNV